MGYGARRNNNQGNYNQNYSYNGNQGHNQRPSYKKSGFQVKMMPNDEFKEPVPICNGWRKTKMGVQKMYARPFKNSKNSVSKSDKKWINLFVTLSIDGQAPINTSGMFDYSTRKLYIKDQNLVGTTNGGGRTASGKHSKGYFGKHIKNS